MSSSSAAYESVIPAKAEIHSALTKRFAALLQALGHFTPATHFAIALSGGADSLALTLLMHAYVAQHGGCITALTVDHRLRAESTHEAQAVASIMRARGIAHQILTPTHEDVSNNLQETARAWRYEALSDHCRAHGILHCLVAHNAGDNRETAHHNIQRGDTADGATGMRASRNYQGVRFLRPLLGVERGELEHYLRAQNMQWIDDPSNSNERFARVRTRRMLEKDPAVRTALDATITEQRSTRQARDEALAQAAMRCVTMHPLGFADIDVTQWRTLETTLASQLLADCITTISGRTMRPRGRDTHRIADALHGDFTRRTLQQCELSVAGTVLRIARERSRVASPITLSGTGELQWDERFSVRYDLPEGMEYRLAALGVNGRKKGKAQWGNEAADLPPASPALWHLDELVYLPHIELPHMAATQVRIGFSPPKPLAAAPFW